MADAFLRRMRPWPRRVDSTPSVLEAPGKPLACVEHAIYAWNMSKMIQLRNVPDSVHRTLKARAALAGMSLSDYLIAEVRQLAARPTMSELRERVRQRERVTSKVAAADIIRAERDHR